MMKITLNEDKPWKPSVHALHNHGVLKDLLLTLAAALWTGFATSILFVLLVFVTHGDVQASEDRPGYLHWQSVRSGIADAQAFRKT